MPITRLDGGGGSEAEGRRQNALIFRACGASGVSGASGTARKSMPRAAERPSTLPKQSRGNARQEKLYYITFTLALTFLSAKAAVLELGG